MLATFVFVLVTITGILLTVLALHRAKRNAQISHHRHALILTIGLGLTWTAAFFAPLSVAGNSPLSDSRLILFGIGHSLFVACAIYCVARLLLKLKSQR